MALALAGAQHLPDPSQGPSTCPIPYRGPALAKGDNSTRHCHSDSAANMRIVKDRTVDSKAAYAGSLIKRAISTGLPVDSVDGLTI